jgi:hypothetical protein
MNTVTSSNYIEQNYHSDDRLAVVIKNNLTGQVIQRLDSAQTIASPYFQRWLRFQNSSGGSIYLSVNSLQPEATGRTRAQIETIRHVYLDIDQNGPAVLAKILGDPRIPQPNYVLNTSPGKFQILWRVEEFTLEEAERLQRIMAAEFGADQSVVDAARVLRIPNFLNAKYAVPYQVTVERLSAVVYRSSDFHLPLRLSSEASPKTSLRPAALRPSGNGRISQSERDWADTMRRLSLGEDPASVQALLERKRYDKADPKYYASLTVSKALQELQRRRAGIAGPEL